MISFPEIGPEIFENLSNYRQLPQRWGQISSRATSHSLVHAKSAIEWLEWLWRNLSVDHTSPPASDFDLNNLGTKLADIQAHPMVHVTWSPPKLNNSNLAGDFGFFLKCICCPPTDVGPFLCTTKWLETVKCLSSLCGLKRFTAKIQLDFPIYP